MGEFTSFQFFHFKNLVVLEELMIAEVFILDSKSSGRPRGHWDILQHPEILYFRSKAGRKPVYCE